jgi:hypothetical protein
LAEYNVTEGAIQGRLHRSSYFQGKPSGRKIRRKSTKRKKLKKKMENI